MGFPRKLLNQDEEIILDLRPHWIFLTPAAGILLGVIVFDLLIAWALGFDFGNTWRQVVLVVLLIPLAGALGLFLHRYSRWTTTQFVVTNQRLISGRGVITKHRKEIPLDRINDVTYNQRVLERIVGAGNLTIESAGERGRERFTHIVHPDEVQQHIYQQMEWRQKRFQMPYAQQPPAAPVPPQSQGATVGPAMDPTMQSPPAQAAPTPPSSAPAAPPQAGDRSTTSIPEQIEQLHGLYERGLLSKAEYDAKKAELLSRM